MKAYERLLRYATVYTTSDPDSGLHPSSARQFDLAHLLEQEMKELGIQNVRVDEHSYVYGEIPATPGCENRKAIGFIAHMDTAPDAAGENVKPQLHPNYDGGDVILPGNGAVLSPAQFPCLNGMVGQTLITTDGTTLLGCDDKGGIAAILTMAETVLNSGKPHGKICIGFTPDEEIGEGASLFDVPGFGADFGYTVDGGDAGSIDFENFNGAAARVTVNGLSVHPGTAKDTMINAADVAIEFHKMLPELEKPQYTEEYEGFFHLCSMVGDVNVAKLGYIVRDHDKAHFEIRKQMLAHIAKLLNEKYGEGTVELDVKDSYYNMAEQVRPHFHLIENARKATRMAGMEPIETPIRGGTDGATLSYKGLPCPNLGTGGFNFHGVYECTSVEKLDQATQVLVNLVELYSTFEG